MGLIIKLVVGVKNMHQVDTTNLLSGALLYQVVLHMLNDGTYLRLTLQVLHTLGSEISILHYFGKVFIHSFYQS